MDYTRANKLPGILLFIDFEKAFDSLEWTFLEKCLSQFGFGPHFTRWVNIFYKDIQSCITDNGLCSHYFNIEHGGPPFSLPFCLRCWNPSDCYSKPKRHQRNKNNELGTKLLQFADDTTVVLPGLESARALFALLDCSDKISGLKQKTEAMWIGSLWNCEMNHLETNGKLALSV